MGIQLKRIYRLCRTRITGIIVDYQVKEKMDVDFLPFPLNFKFTLKEYTTQIHFGSPPTKKNNVYGRQTLILKKTFKINF